MFENRLRKNARHFRKWAKTRGLTAFRVYDRDIPEYPYAVDLYGDRVHLVEYPRRRALKQGGLEEQRAEVLAAVSAVLEVPPEHVSVKTHLPQPWGRAQYGRQGEAGERLVVEEQGLKFWVNLGDYLDTGLFMDHRLTRARVRDEARGKRFLNLFCYTGAFTVYAAAGGAASTLSVDLSNTYLDWLRTTWSSMACRSRATRCCARTPWPGWRPSARSPSGMTWWSATRPPSPPPSG
jgi:23S rRNA (cytosine1962-C5)-methyltransferase